MHLISRSLADFDPALPAIALSAPRLHLRKRRWRGIAADGREFGFDLVEPLTDGAAIFQTAEARYVMQQLPEPVLELSMPSEGAAAARLGWLIGNLHLSMEALPGVIRVIDDPAVRQLCQRENLSFAEVERVFHPLTGGHSHAASNEPDQQPQQQQQQ